VVGDAELIRTRVQAALAEGVSEEFVRDLLAELRNGMRDAGRSARRATGLMVLLAATFELINRRGISEASLFFVKLRSFNFALVAIPVIIAYLCYEMSGYVVELNDFYWVHSKAVETRYPSVWANDLQLFLVPVSDPFGQAMRAARFSPRNRFFTVLGWLRFPLQIVLPHVAACAFVAYGTVQIFRRFGPTDILVWTSSVLAVFFLALALAGVVTELPHRDGGSARTGMAPAKRRQGSNLDKRS
jgi:hypothetical protein